MDRILLMIQRIGAMVKSRLARPEEMAPKVTVLLQELVAVQGPTFDDKLAVLSELVDQNLVTELQSQIAGEALVASLMEDSSKRASAPSYGRSADHSSGSQLVSIYFFSILYLCLLLTFLFC